MDDTSWDYGEARSTIALSKNRKNSVNSSRHCQSPCASNDYAIVKDVRGRSRVTIIPHFSVTLVEHEVEDNENYESTHGVRSFG